MQQVILPAMIRISGAEAKSVEADETQVLSYIEATTRRLNSTLIRPEIPAL
jgi:hypothetical protein